MSPLASSRVPATLHACIVFGLGQCARIYIEIVCLHERHAPQKKSVVSDGCHVHERDSRRHYSADYFNLLENSRVIHYGVGDFGRGYGGWLADI